jgi:hypothetical protein
MATETSVPRPAGSAAGVRDRRRPPSWAPGALAVLVCAGLGVLSVLTLPSVPDYDEFSWLVWGRELAHQIIGPHQPFNLLGGPSWKPFPVLWTTIFGFTGSAVALWVAFVRAAGLFGLVLAYRVAARLAEEARWKYAGRVAGTLAAIAVCLTLQWFHFMFRATSEPLTITATLLWVDRMLAGRRLQGLLAGMVLATMRPEATAFVGIYALWLLWREPGVMRRLAAVGGVGLVALAWIVPPWIANGQPLQASNRARAYAGNQGHQVATFVLQRAGALVVAPVLVLALVLLGLALWRRDRIVLGLVAASLAYVGIIELMALHGFPGLPRFMLPAAAVVCVLAAVALVRVASMLGGGVASAVAAAALVALAVPFCITHASRVVSEHRFAETAARWDHALITAAERAGGARSVLPCRSSQAAVNHVVQPSLAWDLGVPLTRVWPLNSQTYSLKGSSVAFVAHGNAIVGLEPRRLRPGYAARTVTRWKMWHALRITRIGDPRANRCVGDRAASGAPRNFGALGGFPGHDATPRRHRAHRAHPRRGHPRRPRARGSREHPRHPRRHHAHHRADRRAHHHRSRRQGPGGPVSRGPAVAHRRPRRGGR